MTKASFGRAGDGGSDPDGALTDGILLCIEWMRKHFDAERATEVALVYQLELTGAGGGECALSVCRGRLVAERGRAARWDVLLRARADDWIGILHGRENADLLYLAGRLEIQGDLAAATRLRTFFRG